MSGRRGSDRRSRRRSSSVRISRSSADQRQQGDALSASVPVQGMRTGSRRRSRLDAVMVHHPRPLPVALQAEQGALLLHVVVRWLLAQVTGGLVQRQPHRASG